MSDGTTSDHPIRRLARLLELSRPLAVIDLETTGLNAGLDRIVEISVLKIHLDGRAEQWTRRLNPGMPIPSEATEVHGITDDDVHDASAFDDVATELHRLLDDCDLCGFNLRKFDLRVLRAEFYRAGRPLDMAGRAVVDALDVFFRHEPRNLEAAVRFYLGREHEGAHSAAADAAATAEVLGAMLERYEDLPRTVSDLHRDFIPADAVDAEGKFIKVEGQIRFTFGKYRGQPLEFVAREDSDYLRWLLGKDFADEVKHIVRQSLREADLTK